MGTLDNRVGFNLLTFSAIAIFLGTGCAKKLPYQILKPSENIITESNKSFITGKLHTLEGHVVDLSEIKKPIVLQFGSDSCAECHQQTRGLISALQYLTGEENPKPTEVEVFAILVNGTRENALQYLEETSVSWPIAYGDNREIYQRYCSGIKIPCSVIQTPEKGIVYQSVGSKTYKDLSAESGPWVQPIKTKP